MDNASTHVSSYTIHNLIEMNVKVHFNTKYTPEFAPIELLFGHLKYQVR